MTGRIIDTLLYTVAPVAVAIMCLLACVLMVLTIACIATLLF